jgi:hypothetical protein
MTMGYREQRVASSALEGNTHAGSFVRSFVDQTALHRDFQPKSGKRFVALHATGKNGGIRAAEIANSGACD